MSLYKDASLVMIPSAYKDGKLYSIRPTDGSGDFTFSRGSNLAATRVDVNGLIEKGRENRFLQSNNFNTSWTLSAASITSGHSGYDGTNNAWELIESATTAEHLIRQTPSFGGVVTLSVYAKANTRDWLWLRGVTGGANIRAWFDLSNGTTGGSSGSLIDYTMTSAGGGWWRCSLTLNHDAAFEYYIGLSSADGSAGYAGDGSSSIYIQDAQLEAGLVATDYIETGASTAQAGILEDMPRLDYSGSCPALLLEPQRTNVVVNSEYFGGWTNIRTTDTSNAAISPEGLQNATSVKPDSTPSTSHEFFGYTGGAYTTWSGFFKADGYSWIYMFLSGQPVVWYDIENGVVGQELGGATGQIEDYGNGWYRCIYTAPSANSIIGFGIVDGDGTTLIASPDTSQGILFYGAQQEAGSYPTSYIPTYGSSVTRSRDFAEATFAENDIAPTGGTTLFIEFETSGEVDTTPNTGGFYLKNNAGTFGYWGMSFGYGDRIYSNYQNGSTIQWDGSTAQNTLCKVAFQFVNGGKSFLNGTTKATTSVDWSTRPLGQLELQYGTKVKQAVLFPTILTDAECIALTTL